MPPFATTARKVEAEIKRLITVIQTEIGPSLREDSGKAVRGLAEQLRKLADALDRQQRPPQ